MHIGVTENGVLRSGWACPVLTYPSCYGVQWVFYLELAQRTLLVFDEPFIIYLVHLIYYYLYPRDNLFAFAVFSRRIFGSSCEWKWTPVDALMLSLSPRGRWLYHNDVWSSCPEEQHRLLLMGYTGVPNQRISPCRIAGISSSTVAFEEGRKKIPRNV